VPRQRDNPRYQIGSSRIDLIHELPVDFDVVEGKTPEQIKIAVLGPEIVNGEFHPSGFQRSESGRCPRTVGKQKPLGEFQHEAHMQSYQLKPQRLVNTGLSG